MGFNLNKNDLVQQAEDGYEFELTHPDTNEGLGGFITVRGARSKTIENFNRKKMNEYLREEQAQKAKGKQQHKTYEDLEETLVARAVLSVISWREFNETVDGKEVPIPFSKERATELFTAQPWMRDQVLEASNDSEKFRPD